MTIRDILALRHKARTYYPNSSHNQRRWVYWMYHLLTSKRHVTQAPEGTYTLRSPTVLGVN